MIKVYGASDDLIEVEGDVSEEFTPKRAEQDNESNYLAFSNGVVLEIEYTRSGRWSIRPIKGGTRVTIEFSTDDDGTDEDRYAYSDKATIEETVSWVVFGSRIESA